MAVGDMVADNQSVASGAYLDIAPSGSQEYMIHNIYTEAEVSLHWYDGTNNIQFTPATAAGISQWIALMPPIHCKAGHRLRIKNENAGSKRIGYDGVLGHT